MSYPIEALVEYFTGQDVGFFSVCLQTPDGPLHLAERAKRFFATRQALGINGYDCADDARKAIKAAFATHAKKRKPART